MRTKLLLLLLLANFSIYAQTNLVPNGDFENWSSSSQPDNWYRYFSGLVYQNSTAHKGNSSTNMEITSGTFNFMNSSSFAIEAGKTYKISLYQKLVSGTFSSIELSLTKADAFKTTIKELADASSLTSEWRKIEFDYAATTSQSAEISVWITGTEGSQVLIDNVSVVDVTVVPEYTSIPDVNFETKLIALGYDSGAIDGKVLTSKISSLTYLNISNSSIADLAGIENFINLKTLDCRGNELTDIDLSKNVLLEALYCMDNKLVNINITKNTNLTNLACYNNQLTSLDLQNNTLLTQITCYSNQISALDFSKNTMLSVVSCSENMLTSLDFSNNPNVSSIYCIKNSLSSLDVSKCTLLENLELFANHNLTTLNLLDNKVLVNLDVSVNALTSLDLSQNTILKKVDCRGNELTDIILPNTTTLTYLNCSQNKLGNIDVTKNLNLVELFCSFNQISTLNVSENKLLKNLYCQSNKLKEIDASQNTALTTFYCHQNQLVNLNLKNGKNTLLNNANIMLNSNPGLTCVQVDDVDYSNANWLNKDATAFYATSCGSLGLEESVFDQVAVYPNPTKGEVHIDNIALEKTTVYNTLGQLVKTVTLDSDDTSNTIDLSGLSKGVYYIYLISGDAASAKKIIVE